MLVLSRKVEEAIQIGDDVTITVIKVKGNTVRLGISAPSDVRVIRKELELEISGDSAAKETGNAALEKASDRAIAEIKTTPEQTPHFSAQWASDEANGNGNSRKNSAGKKAENALSRMRRNSANAKTGSNASGKDASSNNQSGLSTSEGPVNRVKESLDDDRYQVHFLKFPAAQSPNDLRATS